MEEIKAVAFFAVITGSNVFRTGREKYQQRARHVRRPDTRTKQRKPHARNYGGMIFSFSDAASTSIYIYTCACAACRPRIAVGNPIVSYREFNRDYCS